MDEQPTVFVIDDDPAIRKSLRWLIEAVGLSVRTYESADEFLQIAQSEMVGCLVLDVRMPGLDGLALQDSLRCEGIEIPIIILTGYADVPMAVRAMKAGAFHFLEKPVSPQGLLDHVQQAVAFDAHRRTSQAEQREIVRRLNGLTKREREVINLVVRGMSSKEIANELQVSFKTIEAHRSKIMKKMQAKSVPHLIHMSVRLLR